MAGSIDLVGLRDPGLLLVAVSEAGLPQIAGNDRYLYLTRRISNLTILLVEITNVNESQN